MRLASVGIFALLSTFIVAFTATGVAAASDRMTIRSHPDVGGKCIDVPYAQFSPGMRVQMWTCNGGASQTFSHDDQSQQLQIGGLCVEAWGRGDPQDGVGLGTCDGKPNQQWRMQASGNYYQIIGTNGLCLEVRYGAKDDGAALDLMMCDATRAQRLWVVDGHAEASTAEKAANESRSTAQGQTFLGCFKDNVKPEDLGNDAFAERSDNLTGARCVATCRARGYRFAATQNGRHVFAETSTASAERPTTATSDAAATAQKRAGVSMRTAYMPPTSFLLSPPRRSSWGPGCRTGGLTPSWRRERRSAVGFSTARARRAR
jgi:hypothetical protein